MNGNLLAQVLNLMVIDGLYDIVLDGYSMIVLRCKYIESLNIQDRKYRLDIREMSLTQ